MFYAAYGSNLHPGRLRRRIASARLLGTARLEDWQLSFQKRSWVDGSGKCTLHPRRAGEVAHLAVYSIDKADRPTLDRIEGLGKGYFEAWLEVPGFGPTFTYLAASTHLDASLLPFAWYRDLVVLSCETLGFPGSYIEALRSHPSTADPQHERRAAHLALIEALVDEGT